MLLQRGSFAVRSGGHISKLARGLSGKLSRPCPNGGGGGSADRKSRSCRPLSSGAGAKEVPRDRTSSGPTGSSPYAAADGGRGEERRPRIPAPGRAEPTHRSPPPSSSPRHDATGLPAVTRRVKTGDRVTAARGEAGGGRAFDGPVETTAPIGPSVEGDDPPGAPDERHQSFVSDGAAEEGIGVDGGPEGDGALRSSRETRNDDLPPPPAEGGVLGGDEAPHAAERTGDARGHKMWILNDGDKTVSELDWEEEEEEEGEGREGAAGAGAARDDNAVIQFHSQKHVYDVRFQGYGVVKQDKAEDIRTLVDSFTAPALAAALRDRETALHTCAHLLEKGDLAGVRKALLPFTEEQVANSRREVRRLYLDPEGFTKTHMYIFRKVLQRLPRHVTTHTETRASVVVPLCNVDGVASVLFTKRSSTLRAHSNEVCFPGGKVDSMVDQHIIQTALREMGEEIGIQEASVDVLGVLRCDWAEVASLVGVAVTPVVGFLGNLSREQITPNPDEVSSCFTIPIRYLMEEDRWRIEKYVSPAFVGGPYAIWGLTGYILHRLVHDVLRKHLIIE